MRMERIRPAVKEGPKAEGIKDLMTDKEKALNFAVLAEEELTNLSSVVSAAGPVPPSPRREHIRSLVNKLNVMAQSPDGSAPIDLTPEEQKELMPLVGKYQRSADQIKTAEKFMSDDDLETIVRVIALHPGEADIAGILALDDSSAKERVARAMKVYAFKDPGRYANIVNNFAAARNFVRSDWNTLNELFSTVEKYGIDRGTVMQTIDRDDWKDLLTAAAAARMQGKDSFFSNLKSGVTQIGFQHDLGRISAIVDKYRSHGADRLRITGEISNALRGVFLQEGVAGAILTQEALQPNAPSETRRAYDGIKGAQREMNSLMGDRASFENSLRTKLSGNPLWARRSDPAVSEQLAQNWLEDGYRGSMNGMSPGASGGGFWTALWEFMSSLLGVAYDRSDVQKVANQIRGL